MEKENIWNQSRVRIKPSANGIITISTIPVGS